jgi:flavin reductase (DIM6/NTAB) family NADH-FMN oxidoreductase RutF
MARREIALTEGLERTLEALQKQGLLLSSVDREGKPNVMTIGWAAPGVIWGRPMFLVLVRPSRFTFTNIEATGEFVVNVPTEDMKEVCTYCGTASGRDVDKFAEKALVAVEGSAVSAPLIDGCVAHYECRVVHKGDVRDSELDAAIRSECYGQGDLHRVYYGRILTASAGR